MASGIRRMPLTLCQPQPRHLRYYAYTLARPVHFRRLTRLQARGLGFILHQQSSVSQRVGVVTAEGDA